MANAEAENAGLLAEGVCSLQAPNNSGCKCGLSGAQVALEGGQLMRKHVQPGKDRLDQTTEV